MRSKLTDAVSHAATALVVLAVGGVLSVTAAVWMSNQVEREARLQFENTATEAHNAIESRIRAYSDVLIGVRGLFAASNSVSRADFRDYIDSLDLKRRYPGIVTVNYAHRITAGQKQAFEAAVRNDTSVDPGGYPDFTVRPPGNRPEYVVVQYIEPMAGRKAVLGFDGASEAVRLAALERTRDSNRITASGNVALALDPHNPPGFLMRLPVYRRGMPLATVAQRREAFTGMVGTVFIMTDLMRGVLSEPFLQQTQVRIHDAGFLDGAHELQPPTAENLMFDSDSLLAAPASPPASNDGRPAGPASMSVLDVGGRRWNMYFSSRQKLVAAPDRWLPLATLLGGITISLLLFGLMRSLATVGSRATTLAASITEDLRQSEARLARSQRMTQELIEVLPNPVYFKGIDGRYLGVNKAWEAYFGMPRQAFIGKTEHDLYPDNPEVAARLHADDQSLWDHPGTKVYETSITTAGGRRHDAIYYKATFTHADASVAGLIGTIVDITERKQAAEVNARLAAIIESSNDAIISLTLDVTILTWNAGAERLFGWTAEEAIGRPISMLMLIPPEREEEVARNQIQLQAGRPLMAYDTVRLTKDGRRIEVSLTLSPIKDRRGEMTGVSVIFHDISERRRAEEARSELEVRLREAQKLEAIGTLAGGIAHDFNNILGAIIGNAALARQDVGAGHPALVSLDEIDKASQRAKDLVQQILVFSRKQPQQLLIRPLRSAVEDAVKLLRATLPASVEIVAAISDPPLYVLADATQIQQVLMNLCTNAWHAMEGRAGRIEIGLDAVLLDAAAAGNLSGLQPGPHACLSVSDNGCGMDAATQARIFEPFFTTKAVDQGTGLGLSVVHGIVKAHHGAITLQSAPGEGATFQIYFPAVAEPRAEALPEPAAPGSARGSGQHVLYVDDDEAMVFLVTRMLEGLGYRISGYERAEEALEAVRADAEDFDLVVTDFNMPGLSGLEMAQELARIRPELPVVITSGYITEDLRANALRAGVRHLVYKPNTIDELCQIIQRLLATASA